jgi:hypothetical protein
VTYTNLLQLLDGLQDGNAVRRVRQLGRQRGAQPRQAGADDDDVNPLIGADLFTHFAGCMSVCMYPDSSMI